MPQAKSPAEKLLVNELQQGVAARIILIAIEGAELPHITQISKRLVAHLRNHEAFVRVDNGEQSLQSLEDTPLFRYRYLLSPNITVEHFSAQTLAGVFQQRLLDLTSPFALFNKQLLPKDPTNEIGALTQRLMTQDKTHRQFGVWVSPDNRRALLLAETRAPGYELQAQQEAINAIHSSFDQISKDPSTLGNANAGLRLILSGPAVFATNSRNQIQREVTNLSIAASVVVMLILWLAYRNLSLVFINAIPLVSALLVASAVLTLMYGPIHGITLAFGITVIGVAIDYPIHLFSHLSGKQSVSEEFKIIWPTMRLGVLTTVAGYSAMTATNFSGLAQLGWFAIIGLITAVLVTRWVIPNLLPTQFSPVSHTTVPKRLGALLHPGRKAIIGALLLGVAGVVVIALNSNRLWETDLSSLSPIPKQQLRLDRQLRDDMGAPDATHMVLLSAPTAEAALQQSENLQPWLTNLVQQNAISDFDAAYRYLPSQQTQLQRQALLPEKTQLEDAVTLALQGLPFKQAQFHAFIQAVADAKIMQPITLEQLQGSALGIKVESLLIAREDGWNAIILLHGVNNSELIAASVPQQSNMVYLDLKYATNQLIQGFRSEALTRIQWAAVFIVLVLAVGMRKPKRMIAALLPVVLAITITVAFLLAMGQSLSLFNLVALLLVFGIGIDYGLFFSGVFISRQESAELMRQRTFHALSVCALSTVSVFGILSLSAVPVLLDIGITVGIGVLLSFILALLLSQQLVAQQTIKKK